MKNIFLPIVGALLLSVSCSPGKVADYNIIPAPQEVSLFEHGGFTVDSSVKLVVDGSMDEEGIHVVDMFAESYSDLFGINFKRVQVMPDNHYISFSLGLQNVNDEAYTISVFEKGITVQAVTCAGLFHATQSILKMTDPGRCPSIQYPYADIKDWPRFGYRGLMLDVSRHFSDVDMVKRTIDMLALHQLNVFHWHLTDDQGWRIEIESHPELTTVGAWRDGTVVGRYLGTPEYETDGVRHGGYYTQEEIKEIVSYAAERYIEVIPEIDLPGHTSAVLAAYPSLGCQDKEYKVADRWGVIQDVVCAGNPESLQLFIDVMDEVCELFPSQYIHLGGDECVKDRWRECPECQQKIKELRLKDGEKYSKEDYLQSWFMGKVAAHIQSKGKNVIGWDEILEGVPMDSSVIMSWRGVEGGIAAARMGHDAIMTPVSYLYFDHSQTLDSQKEEIPVGGFTDIKKVYSYEPLPVELTPEEQEHIIGVQANVWCEYMPEERIRQYQILPRLAALSEIQWTMPERKDYLGFLDRLPRMIKNYNHYGWNYARHIFDVACEYEVDTDKACLSVNLSTLGNDDIYYTLDGTDPKESGVLYNGPFDICGSAVLKTVVLRNGDYSDVVQNFTLDHNKATFQSVEIISELNVMQKHLSHEVLTDGIVGSIRCDDCKWMSCVGTMEFILDFGKACDFSKFSWVALNSQAENITVPSSVSISVSNDGNDFTAIKDVDMDNKCSDNASVESFSIDFAPTSSRYVKVIFKSHSINDVNRPAWVFISDIGLL